MTEKREDIKTAYDELQKHIGLIDKDHKDDDVLQGYKTVMQTACTALKKQMPIRPREEEGSLSISYLCPCCGRFFGMRGMASVALFKTDKFCQNCGQAMDWRGVMR